MHIFSSKNGRKKENFCFEVTGSRRTEKKGGKVSIMEDFSISY
jgi:hypothetical protein